MPNEEPTDLNGIQLRKPQSKHEKFAKKFARKFAQNPFVPIGFLATVGALSYGLWSFRMGKSRLSQQMMRWRIVAQVFTVTAVLAGVMLATNRKLK